MVLDNLKKIEVLFRQFGYEADDVFMALAAHYVDHFDIQMSDRLRQLYNKGKAVLDHVESYKPLYDVSVRLIDSDVRGDKLPVIYQYFLSKRFRDLTGKFFTPKTVAAAMVEMLPLTDGATIVDPTCGGGTFLKEAAKRWKEKPCYLSGNDVDDMLVCLCELNLGVGLDPLHKTSFSSLNIYDDLSQIGELNSKVDYITANPPFSLSINSFSPNSKLFGLGYRNSDALFIDLAYQMLKPGGRLVCLLPHSIISNKEFNKLRVCVENDWGLLAVLVLPEGVFQSTANTTTRADIIVLEKGVHTEKTLFANVSSVGVPLNSKRTQTVSNDLLSVVRDERVAEVLRTNQRIFA